MFVLFLHLCILGGPQKIAKGFVYMGEFVVFSIIWVFVDDRCGDLLHEMLFNI